MTHDEELLDLFKTAAADRMIYHVMPLFLMNLGALGYDDGARQSIVKALMDAYVEDTEIIRETKR